MLSYCMGFGSYKERRFPSPERKSNSMTFITVSSVRNKYQVEIAVYDYILVNNVL